MVQSSVQYGGTPDEDLNLDMFKFLEMCAAFKINGASDDAIRLRMFPFSLKGRAKVWLISLPADSITTWEELALKFFPPGKQPDLEVKSTLFTR